MKKSLCQFLTKLLLVILTTNLFTPAAMYAVGEIQLEGEKKGVDKILQQLNYIIEEITRNPKVSLVSTFLLVSILANLIQWKQKNKLIINLKLNDKSNEISDKNTQIIDLNRQVVELKKTIEDNNKKQEVVEINEVDNCILEIIKIVFNDKNKSDDENNEKIKEVIEKLDNKAYSDIIDAIKIRFGEMQKNLDVSISPEDATQINNLLKEVQLDLDLNNSEVVQKISKLIEIYKKSEDKDKEILRLIEEQKVLRGEINGKKTKIDALENEKEQFEVQKNDIKKQVAECKDKDFDKINRQLEDTKKNLQELEEKVKEYDAEIENLRQEKIKIEEQNKKPLEDKINKDDTETKREKFRQSGKSNSVGTNIGKKVETFEKNTTDYEKQEIIKKSGKKNSNVRKKDNENNNNQDFLIGSTMVFQDANETHFMTLKLDRSVVNLTGKFISQSLICELTTNDNQYSTYYLKLKHKNDSLETKQIFDIVILNFSELTAEEIENEKRNLVEQYYNDPENKDKQKTIVRITVLDKKTENLDKILKTQSSFSEIRLAAFPYLKKIDVFCSLGTDMQHIKDLNSGYPLGAKLGIDAFLKWCLVDKIEITNPVIACATADFMNWYEKWEGKDVIMGNGANIYSDWHIKDQLNPVLSLDPNDWIKRKILVGTFIHLLISGVTPSSKNAEIYKHRIYTNKEVVLGALKILPDICKKLNNKKVVMHNDYKVTLVTYNNTYCVKKGHQQSVYYGFLHPDEIPNEESFVEDLTILQIVNSHNNLYRLMGPDNEYKKVSTQLWETCGKTKEGVQKLSKKVGKGLEILAKRTYYFPWITVGKELYKTVVGDSSNNNNNNGHKKIEIAEVDLKKLQNNDTTIVQSKVGDFTKDN